MRFENPFSDTKKQIDTGTAIKAEGEINEILSKKIVLKSNKVRDFLTKKIKEYQDRSTSNQGQGVRTLDATYKVLLVTELLTIGEVDISQIFEEEKSKPGFDLTIFKSACSVIRDYVENEGKNLVHSGTTKLE